MDAHEIMRLIDDIAAASQRIDKEALIQDLVADDFGRLVIESAYNPFVTYGVRPVLHQDTTPPNMMLTPTIAKAMLKRLETRELVGRAAEREIADTMISLSPASAKLLFLMISKDLKCGIAETTINVAVPGLIPTFAVARAVAFADGKIKVWPQKAEPKLDGNRNTFLCKNGQGGFFTRTGRVVPALDFLVAPVLKAAAFAFENGSRQLRETLSINPDVSTDATLDFMLDGEAMMGLFEDTGALRRKDVDAVGAELHLYDMLSYQDFNKVGAHGPGLDARRALLTEFVTLAKKVLGGEGCIQIVPQYFVNSDEEAMEIFEGFRSTPIATYLARGNKEREAEMLLLMRDKETGGPKMLEGAMIKQPAAQYEKRKCANWLKIKAEESEDLIIIGFYPGKPHTKYENSLGGVIVGRDGVEVRVGGGFSDPERDAIWALLQKDAALVVSASKIDYRGGVKGTVVAGDQFPNPVFKVLGRMIEVEFHEVTPDGSLRHPRYVRFRDDKQGEQDNHVEAA
jgi:ATP-dependent DNA ligase